MNNSHNDEKKYWKTIAEFSDENALLNSRQNEFNEGVTDDFEPNELNKISRRKFFALMSAATALTATACSDYRDKGEIIPYNKRPEGLLPGTPNFYASNVNGISVLVKTREGRPINIEGNPEHPIYKGKVDATTISSILNLYDPERLKEPLRKGLTSTWTDVENLISEKLNKVSKSGKEISIVSKKLSSLAALEILESFKSKYPSSKLYFYDPFENNVLNANQKNYNSLTQRLIDWSKVKIAVSIESDFLAKDSNAVYNTREFSSRRDIMKSDDFIRLYSIEGNMSLTGANADYRISLRPDFHYEFLLSLINEIVFVRNARKNIISNENSDIIKNYALKNFISKHKLDSIKVSYLVNDLIKNAGNGIVICGELHNEATALATNLLNEILGNQVFAQTHVVSLTGLTSSTEVNELVSKMKAGKVGAFINFDADPVFHFSYIRDFAKAIKNVDLTVSFCQEKNDTSDVCEFTLPIHHDLESWNIYQKYNNVVDLQQPVINPIFNTRQKENILLSWLNDFKGFSEDNYQNFVKRYFIEKVYPNVITALTSENLWYNSLHDGFVIVKSIDVSTNYNKVKLPTVSNYENDLICLLDKNYFIGDGQFANNGWLQEIPHPITKITWDNYAAISPDLGKKLNVEMGDVISVSSDNNKIELPVVIQPGLATNMICVEMGYGRKIIGEVGRNVGVDAKKIMSNSSFIVPVNLSKTGKHVTLASTQEHHSLDDTRVKDIHKKRNIIREGTLAEYRKNPKFLHEHEHNLVGITREHKYEGVKWAMAIDLNKCTSCGICVSACNVENNIPVVGKDQVVRGREMHWIRIDRYYSGEPDSPEISNQPMLCQHCDNAPCENVCPVNATNHSPDGLNQMAYNRCVGTRYCSNNCPYKVRRFNFYNFRDHFADAYYENDLTSMINNPEVTVRSRGVMEKCTFCVQKIMEARSNAIREGKEWNGQNVKTACQTACPAEAIVFGNVNDKNSEVLKYREHELAYHVLEELYVKPNVTYIAKLRNTISEES